jgi:hypothetical protein
MVISGAAECERCLKMERVKEVDKKDGGLLVDALELPDDESNLPPGLTYWSEKKEGKFIKLDEILGSPWQGGCFCCELFLNSNSYFDWHVECEQCGTRYANRFYELNCGSPNVFGANEWDSDEEDEDEGEVIYM